jgi:hypothetical protein
MASSMREAVYLGSRRERRDEEVRCAVMAAASEGVWGLGFGV